MIMGLWVGGVRGRPASRGRGDVVRGLGPGQRPIVGVEVRAHNGQRVSLPLHPVVCGNQAGDEGTTMMSQPLSCCMQQGIESEGGSSLLT
jgi:hypothetical protein